MIQADSVVEPAANRIPAPAESVESRAIIHCVRSTVGGIFRHIIDLVYNQSAAGHRVGLICDSLTGGAFEAAKLEALRPYLALGVVQLPMSRSIHPADFMIIREVYRHLVEVEVDVLHCHGAKGGAYGRLAAWFVSKRRQRFGKPPVVTIYSPHGGTLHFNPRSPQGQVYFTLEKFLERLTSELIFVAGFEVEAFRRKVGALERPWTIAYNGLAEEEFVTVTPADNAVDFIYAGHMRDLKGVDLFIDAVEIASARLGRPVRVELIGDGEDRARYQAEVERRRLRTQIRFRDPMPIRQAFARGRSLVVPSRAEAMPYIVLEAIGAGMPVLATSVGGVPEVFGRHANRLIAPGDANMIAGAMIDHMMRPEAAHELAMTLRDDIRERFTVARMVETVNAVYARHLCGAPVEAGIRKSMTIAHPVR